MKKTLYPVKTKDTNSSYGGIPIINDGEICLRLSKSINFGLYSFNFFLNIE